MLVRKNYYLYAENAEKQNEKKKLLGSVRLTRIEEQWTMEIQWKDENDAAALVSKAEEEELQLQIREKEIILRQINRDLREDAADTNADKTEEQELAVTATENIRNEYSRRKKSFGCKTCKRKKEIVSIRSQRCDLFLFYYFLEE